MNHSIMKNSMMDHSMMNHSMMNHSMMNHSMMNTPMVDHSKMDHSSMNHSGHATNKVDHSAHGASSPGSLVDHSAHDMEMKMYFHTGIMEYVLFETCMTKDTGGMAGACIIIFVVAVLYEGLKFLREVLLQQSLSDAPQAYIEANHGGGGGDGDQSFSVKTVQNRTVSQHMLSCAHFIQTSLHMLQVFISYCLMLVFMTYNIWLCLAVILGAGCGYFLFGWKRAIVVDSNEHCH